MYPVTLSIGHYCAQTQIKLFAATQILAAMTKC